MGMDLSTLFSSVGALGVAGPAFEAKFFGFEGEAGFFLQASGPNDDPWHSEAEIDFAADTTAFDPMVSYARPDGIVLQTSLGPVQVDGGR